MSELDDIFMKRAIKLAWEAQGWTAPNPLVGCVIVKDGRIIGEGKHERFGEPHAEINALKKCAESPEGATVYVTLEPCVHYGKTPPCVNALMDAKVSRVVIGSKDPNPKAAGGADYLEQRGVRVDRGIMNPEAISLNAAFYKTITTGLPLLTIKWAMTMDGKIATTSGDSQWVSGDSSRKYVHFLRGTHRAVMIGSGTLLADNPAMNCRISGLPQPLRVFIDGRLRFPLDAKALTVSPAGDCVIVCLEEFARPDTIKALEDRGAKIIVAPQKKPSDGGTERIDLIWVLRYLAREYNVNSVLSESGGGLNGALFDSKLPDRIEAFIAPKVCGGRGSTPVAGNGALVMADAYAFRDVSISKTGDDIHVSASVGADDFTAAGRF